MNRRNFLTKAGLTLGASTVLPAIASEASIHSTSTNTWDAIRGQFPIDTSKIQMAQMLLASHPTPVRDAIQKYREALDKDPADYVENNLIQAENRVLKAAGNYLEANPRGIALTDSTTMGLSMLYNGLDLKPGDDVLSTTHDHYSTEKSLEFASKRTGASLRHINLYESSAKASKGEILDNLEKHIQPNTRIVAVTYVHSSTGVKLPIPEMAALIQAINKKRGEKDRIYFCVDGVHGFGIENITVEELGCDFLVAGTHKWLFGPRGTGIVWARDDAWDMVNPIIPPFSIAYYMWMNKVPDGPLDFYSKISPGGFHSFEHRWALNEAFDFHMEVGKEKIQDRTHELNSLLKKGLKGISHVKLHTPLSSKLSSGIVSFEIEGIAPNKVIKKLHEKNIIGSTTPYKAVYARLTPCIINTEDEVHETIKAVENLRG